MAKKLPWTISDTKRWRCSVPGCRYGGLSRHQNAAGYDAAQHAITHTDDELSSTGYTVKDGWKLVAVFRQRANR